MLELLKYNQHTPLIPKEKIYPHT